MKLYSSKNRPLKVNLKMFFENKASSWPSAIKLSLKNCQAEKEHQLLALNSRLMTARVDNRQATTRLKMIKIKKILKLIAYLNKMTQVARKSKQLKLQFVRSPTTLAPKSSLNQLKSLANTWLPLQTSKHQCTWLSMMHKYPVWAPNVARNSVSHPKPILPTACPTRWQNQKFNKPLMCKRCSNQEIAWVLQLQPKRLKPKMERKKWLKFNQEWFNYNKASIHIF